MGPKKINLCENDSRGHFLLQISEDFVFPGLEQVQQMVNVVHVHLKSK
jgi:hypothetical protein